MTQREAFNRMVRAIPSEELADMGLLEYGVDFNPTVQEGITFCTKQCCEKAMGPDSTEYHSPYWEGYALGTYECMECARHFSIIRKS